MSLLAVTAIGADRPGIIARVTGVLVDHGGNIHDSQMTILGGQFAIMLLVAADVAPATLEEALARATADLGLVVTVREVEVGGAHEPASHVLSVYGQDRPGIVHEVATVLAAHDVNVTDLTTQVLVGEEDVYAMVTEIAVPEDVEADDLLAAVRAGVEGVDMSLRPLDTVTL